MCVICVNPISKNTKNHLWKHWNLHIRNIEINLIILFIYQYHNPSRFFRLYSFRIQEKSP